jgi:hypothetical protein
MGPTSAHWSAPGGAGAILWSEGGADAQSLPAWSGIIMEIGR